MGKNVTLITGDDLATIEALAKQRITQVAGEDPDPFSLDIVRERDDLTAAETLKQLIGSVLSPPFFGGHKTVWLQSFSAFDSEGSKTSTGPIAVAFHRLAEIILGGLSEDIVLVMSGPGVDQRKALFKACKAEGEIILCPKPNVRDRQWQAKMALLLRSAAAAKGLDLTEDVSSYLVAALGTDTGRIDGELEKLVCYCGGADHPITLEAAQEVCHAEGEAISWALRDALGNRDGKEALRLVDVLLRREKDPDGAVLGLLLQVANGFRHLLQVRVFMQAKRIRNAGQVRNAVQGLTDEERSSYLDDGLEVVSFHPFRVGTLAPQAMNYSGQELVHAIVEFRDACWKCVSSSLRKRVVLEEMIVSLVRKPSP